MDSVNLQPAQAQPLTGASKPADEARGLAPAREPPRDPAPGVAAAIQEEAACMSERGLSAEFENSLRKMGWPYRVDTVRHEVWIWFYDKAS
mgnify:CR=1 FL=1